jgi:uncharacterized protein YoxC
MAPGSPEIGTKAGPTPISRNGCPRGGCKVDFSEQPPSKQWAALKYGGDKFAEVWFKPGGEPFAVAIRIPRESFQIPGMDQLLSMENLLKAVAIATEEVESWRHGGDVHSGMTGSDPELRRPLPAPPQDVTHLNIHVSLKPPPQVVAPKESCEPQRKWQDLEARWQVVLGVEVAIKALRQTMESLQAELQTSMQQSLALEEKRHALNRDVAQWNQEKSRAHFAVPKVREFIHRATWALDTPERKALAKFFQDDLPPDIPFSQINEVADQVERLLKDRQVLSANGTKVHQESKSIAADIQAALRALRSNAAANAERKRRAASPKSKFFKDARRLSGLD